LLAAIVTRALLTHLPPHLSIDLAQPLPVAGGWGAFGAAVFAVVATALAFGTLAYWQIVANGAVGFTATASIAGMSAVSLACAFAVPIVFSSDIYAYAAYGALALGGHNPYAHAPLPGGVPIFDAAIVQWGNPPPACVYGPIFIGLAAAVDWASASFGTVVTLGVFRITACAALVACALLAAAAYPGDRRARLTAAATIALNPVIIWCAAEGHNDALALCVVLAGVALAARGRAVTGSFVAALAGAIKLPALTGGFVAAASGRARFAAIAGSAVALVLSIPLFAGFEGTAHGAYAPQASLQAIVYPLARMLLPARVAAPATWAVAVGAAAACVAAALQRLRNHQPEGWTFLALAGWLLLPNPYPWYGLWLAAIAAVAPGTRGAAVLLGLTFASVLRYVPDVVTPGTPPADAWLGVAATFPLLLLVRPRGFGIINRSP